MAYWFRNNFLLFFFGIFAFIGTIMGIVALWNWIDYARLTNEGIHTQGEVVEMIRNSDGGSLAPVVEFRLKSGEMHQYQSNIYSSPPSYHVGERVEVWYNPANPDEVALEGIDSWLFPLIFGIFFLVFGGIGYGGLIYQILKKRNIQWLQYHGQAIEADFTGVGLDTSFKVNGSSPYVVECQWLDRSTNKMYQYKSRHIWYDPSNLIQQKTIRVLIDPNNPGLYDVDISFLPEQGN
ncbi:MAG: DUF3592 domain-containing protein [Saprospiraceae bacterium]|nr:DUF3592 domain-containing protein [Saprospiraceae bacterium]